jgi:hypothetical protein
MAAYNDGAVSGDGDLGTGLARDYVEFRQA